MCEDACKKKLAMKRVQLSSTHLERVVQTEDHISGDVAPLNKAMMS